ncbi:MAG: hypothetical protein V8S34_03585 [Lawsonibacter sp.]
MRREPGPVPGRAGRPGGPAGGAPDPGRYPHPAPGPEPGRLQTGLPPGPGSAEETCGGPKRSGGPPPLGGGAPPLPEEPPAPGEMERVFDVPEPEPVPGPAPRPAAQPAAQPAPQQRRPAQPVPLDGDRAFWPSFAAGLKGKVPPTVHPYLSNGQKVTGVWKNGSLTLWTDSEFTRAMLNKPAVLAGLKRAAADSFGGAPQVSVVCGTPPPEEPGPAPVQSAAPVKNVSGRSPQSPRKRMPWMLCWPLGSSLTT